MNEDDPSRCWTDDDDLAVLEAYDATQLSNWRAVVLTLYRVLGPLTPEFVVEFARPPGSPLHECFTWGPGVIDQARTMLEAWSPDVQRPDVQRPDVQRPDVQR
jgi:hypothetical protein